MAVEGYSNEDWMAQGVTLEGSYSPTQLFTAEDDIKTAAGTFASGNDVAVLTILARNTADQLVPWDPAAVDPDTVEATPVGVAAADMDTSATGYNGATMGPYYVQACFNPDLLVWPAGLAAATHEEKSAALEAAGAPFRVKHLL